MSERVRQTDLVDAPPRPPIVDHADGPEGLRLPLIDIDHSDFRVALDAQALDRLGEAFVAEQTREQRSLARRLFSRFVLPRLLRRSRVGRGLVRARGGVLDGLTTYLLKLGPRQLHAPWASEMDRRIGASFAGLSLRLRLQDVTELLAAALAPQLAERPDRPLWLVSLSGGPAMDCLNALLRLQRAAPPLLANREVRVVVLEPDRAMAEFGGAALDRWRAAGGPLEGVHVDYQHAPYDWAEVTDLDRVLSEVPAAALLAISSEGGLFDYADDACIAASLRAIRTHGPADATICGTLNSPGRAGALLNRGSLAAVRPRTLEALGTLAARAGWTVVDARERTLNTAFSLKLSSGTSAPSIRPRKLRHAHPEELPDQRGR